jgi:hypothetical protein
MVDQTTDARGLRKINAGAVGALVENIADVRNKVAMIVRVPIAERGMQNDRARSATGYAAVVAGNVGH